MKSSVFTFIALINFAFAVDNFDKQITSMNFYSQKCYQEIKRASHEPQTVDYLIYEYDDGKGIESPLYLNEHYLYTSMQRILTEMPKDFKKYLATQDLALCTKMKFSSVKDTIGRIEWLESRTRRLKYLNSQKDKFIALRSKDVRGYLFLQQAFRKNPGLKKTALSAAPAEVESQLLGMCMNTNSAIQACRQWLDPRKTVGELFDVFKSSSEKIYHSALNIDLSTNYKGIQKKTNGNTKILNLLFDVAEDQHGSVWRFLSSFIPRVWSSRNLTVQPIISDDVGATPLKSNDQAYGGNLTAFVISYATLGTRELYLNLSTNFNTKTGRYLLTHELGHVIGFPDCYVEFFEYESDAFVSYNLDENNIMCSGRGRVLPSHFDKIRQSYFQ